MGRERLVLCGGASAPEGTSRSSDKLALNVWETSGAINVALPVDDIHGAFWSEIPPAFLDLLEIATYVYAADQATTRGGMDVDTFGGAWRRSFIFHVPVREVELWKSKLVTDVLCRTLSFLSDDDCEFVFHPAKGAPNIQQYLTLGVGGALAARPEQVALFSGGLDSLAGAVEEAVVQKRRVVLVNHRPTPKVNGIHRELEQLLAEKAGQFKPMHVPVRIFKDKKIGREPSQRTRSFLYVALGSAVARMLGLDNVRFYENGTVSINLPVCEQVIGARATRTTHPRVLRGFEELLSAIAGRTFRVENPFLWQTKGEVIKRIVQAGCGPLIGESMSCAHTWEFTLEHPHCGTCSQCIDRRFAAIAVGAEQFDPEDRYAVDVFTESIPEDTDRIMMASYLERANELGGIKDPGQFLSRHSEVAGILRYLDRSAASGAAMVLDLYRRHAAEVKKAVGIMLAKNADAIFARTLPGDCVLRIVCESNAVTSLPATAGGDGEASAPNVEVPRFMLRKGLGTWEIVCDGKRGTLNDGRAMDLVAYLLKNPPDAPMHAVVLEAQIAGHDGEGASELLVDGADGAETVAVDRDAVILEASGGRLGAGSNKALRDKVVELKATIDDMSLPEEEREQASREYAELLQSAAGNRKTPGQASRAAERVGKALKRLRDELIAAGSKPSVPNEALRAFGEHIENYILTPSSRYSQAGGRRGRSGLAGCFTYERPDGVIWAD